MLRVKPDRRDAMSRTRLLRRVRGLFARTRARGLTLLESAELLRVREDICARALETLVADGALTRTADGRYAPRRKSVGRTAQPISA
jgi:hypothetical protein